MPALIRATVPALIALATFASALPAYGQDISVTVRALLEGAPVEGARVSSGTLASLTDVRGLVILRLPTGEHVLRIEKAGLRTTAITLQAAADTTLTVELATEALEHEAIIVSSTRTERRIEDEPVRVEVIGREEIEEKLLMTPGDIAMLLNETAGLRVQPTAPSLGGASVRIQGLRGRYTQILSDGLPLYGGQTGALSALQIPPMDLGQVEVIKGVASALYGASALGGVVNLLSRRPAPDGERELLVNQSTLGGTDLIGWMSKQVRRDWGYTMLVGAHRQSRSDVDDDGWADLPSYSRVLVRPRAFWSSERGSSALITAGALFEDRTGGTMAGATTPSGTSFTEALQTRRMDAGTLTRFLIGAGGLLTMRGSASFQQHEHRFGETAERDAHTTAFVETAWAASAGSHSWVVGAALQHERYASRSVPAFDYTHTVPALFAQDEFGPVSWLTLALSARLDRHNEYGAFLNPRLSLLVRPGSDWSLRASAGSGLFAPTPWTEETEAIGLSRLMPSRLRAERARSAAIDLARTLGAFEFNVTLFASRIRQPLQSRASAAQPGNLELFNARADVRTSGTELLARYHREGIHVTATHVYTHATEPDPGAIGRRAVPLTPRHTAGLVAAWERENRGRLGFEFYYTGRQALEENPFRTQSRPYVIVGFLVERHLGPLRVYLNAENLFDTRQTAFDPLVRPARTPEGRWITDVWAPLEGRSFNAGVRWRW
jgi:iron complex outermembrane receptor protein